MITAPDVVAGAADSEGPGPARVAVARRRPVMVAGLVLASAILVVVSVQPDLLLRLLG